MSWLGRLALCSALAGCGAACAVALLTVVSIAGRQAGRPIPGDVELSQFGIALCIALCLPWCQLRRANLIVDFFTQKAPARLNRGLDAFGAVLLAAMVGLLAWRAGVGALAVREAGETTMILGLPMWLSYATLAPGLGLSAVVALAQACGWERSE